ncbi:MAG: hypothetical protein ACR2G4_16955 [Pyrinomonadaceae bacterium]
MIEVDESKAEGAAESAASGSDEAQAQPLIGSLLLQPDFTESGQDRYHVAELLRYHDRHFIENVYQAILRRRPTEAERAREVDDLRSGRLDKIEIIERLSAAPDAGQDAGGGARPPRVRIEGLPSPWARRLRRLPVLGYLLRLARALVRLPVSMQHRQQFEIYALAQQQLIADYINQVCVFSAQGSVNEDTTTSRPVVDSAHRNDVIATVSMFSDALLDLSNSHADLQTQTQTQVEQMQAALTELTTTITVQQQLTEAMRREQQTATDAQREFLIQEQRVIVETQKAILEELREQLRALFEEQQRAREEPAATTAVRRRQSQTDETRREFDGQA